MEKSPLPARVVRPSTKSVGLDGQRKRVPAELAGRGLDLVEGTGADHAVGDALVGFVHDGGADAVGPGAPVEQAGRGKGAAAQLLGVEAEREPSGGRSGRRAGRLDRLRWRTRCRSR